MSWVGEAGIQGPPGCPEGCLWIYEEEDIGTVQMHGKKRLEGVSAVSILEVVSGTGHEAQVMSGEEDPVLCGE